MTFWDRLRQLQPDEEVIDEVKRNYMALGRCHYEISRMIFHARMTVAAYRDNLQAQGQNFDDSEKTLRTITDDTAGRAIPQVLSLCKRTYQHTPKDADIAKRLLSEFIYYNKLRNHLAHASVSLTYGTLSEPRRTSIQAGEPLLTVSVTRINALSEMNHVDDFRSVKDIENFADGVAFYGRRLTEYLNCCLYPGRLSPVMPMPAPAEVLCIRNDRVERINPYSPVQELQILE